MFQIISRLIPKAKGFVENTFKLAKTGSIFNKLYEEKVDSFMPVVDGLETVAIAKGHMAFYYSLESILKYPQYHCLVSCVQIINIIGLSFAINLLCSFILYNLLYLVLVTLNRNRNAQKTR
jgi:hypothetical protein